MKFRTLGECDCALATGMGTAVVERLLPSSSLGLSEVTRRLTLLVINKLDQEPREEDGEESAGAGECDGDGETRDQGGNEVPDMPTCFWTKVK